ncbi:IclR family transcriptional regulator [Gryllotalpicola reticulitermitis]|uniref:IclR family transcriptional regulator n=1 Tax=Gryllotalpicola reticulitermitis TaxID=1184153 RepID=A0ABV8Q7D5_9MICO
MADDAEQGQSEERKPRDMVAKALGLLTLVGQRMPGATLSELARTSKYPTSTTYRLLRSLVLEGFVRYDEQTKRYSLGPTLFILSEQAASQMDFHEITTPVLERLSLVTGDAVLLSVLDGDREMQIQSVRGGRTFQFLGHPGLHAPLHCTALGKVLIAFSEPGERERLLKRLPLYKVGPNAITDRRAFRAEIERVREQGWGVADEEHESGVRSIAMPVLSDQDIAIAAVSIVTPQARGPVTDLERLLPALDEATRQLSVLLRSRSFLYRSSSSASIPRR